MCVCVCVCVCVLWVEFGPANEKYRPKNRREPLCVSGRVTLHDVTGYLNAVG